MSTSVRIRRVFCRVLYFVLALAVAAHAVGYLFQWPNPYNRFAINFAALQHIGVPGHFFYGALALVLTPVQISGAVRRRWPRVHRLTGLVYLMAVAIAGVCALRLAPTALHGTVTRIGFLILGSLWLLVTAYAWQRILVRDFEGHARWMYRSIALTSSAITLRIMLGLGVPLAGLPMSTVYPVAAWGCWLINLALCEWLLRRPSGRRSVSFPHSA
ncbi:MAG: DUF2306 domain-containing protein [Gammaproteobacteria bacterium]